MTTSISIRKKIYYLGAYIALLVFFSISTCLATDISSNIKQLNEPVNQFGTISFKLHTDKTYINGKGQDNYQQQLIKLPGVTTISFSRTDQVINISWTWERQANIHFAGITTDLTELPGEQTYYLQYTWDSARGLAEGYLNGRPLKIPGVKNEAWWVENTADQYIIGSGNLKVSDVKVQSRYTPPEEIIVQVPANLYGKHANLVGFTKQPNPIDFVDRRGELLYESLMDNPESIEGWVKEGPVDISFQDDFMLMRSIDFKEHIVFWCPQDFPDSFIAEWDFEPLSYYGLAIIFFAAKGGNGEDIFDPSLNPRDGRFVHYIRGDIVSYHVSYFANVEDFQMGRPDSNLRKNNNFYRVGTGPVAIKPGATGWQQMRLIKDGNKIQLFANGKICVDWTDDDPDRYGEPHGGGKIGLRQMMPTIGAYRNFRVWKLEQLAEKE